MSVQLELTDRVRCPPTVRLLPEATTPDFRIHRDEALGRALQRIILEQIATAMWELRTAEDIDPAVHRLRKSLKRSRAALRLVRGELGDYGYRQENTALRDTARRWGQTRDAAVLAGVAGKMVADARLDERSAVRVVATLERRARVSSRAAELDRRRHLDTMTALGSFACRVRRFPVVGPGAVPDSFDSLRPGLTRVATRAAKRMGTARMDPTPQNLHAWRKDVKYLGYQLELLRPLWKHLLRATSQRLTDIGSTLGDDHDLAVWSEVLRTDLRLVPNVRERDRLLAGAEARRRELQHEAFGLGATVLGDPDALVRQIAAAWELARG